MLITSCTPPEVCCVASKSLATFGHDTTTLGNILVRTALQEETATATAVLQALLAFSSLHRYGLQSQALELKTAALGGLAKASPNLGANATMQHTAAGMLLCSFEVHELSCTSGQWIIYFGGVKTVLNAFSIKILRQLGSDVTVLLDWVYYYEVLTRFSLLHWNSEEAPELRSTLTDLFCSEVNIL